MIDGKPYFSLFNIFLNQNLSAIHVCFIFSQVKLSLLIAIGACGLGVGRILSSVHSC